MKTHFDIEQFIEAGVLNNELDYERAMVADRKLRLLSKESVHFKTLRSRLRDLIEAYEQKVWSNDKAISDELVRESDLAEQIADAERVFIEKRKISIRKKLKELELSQEELAYVLGHKSKTHMSELMNGIKPFTLSDLVAISLLLKIDLNELIPAFLPSERKHKINTALQELGETKRKKFNAIN